MQSNPQENRRAGPHAPARTAAGESLLDERLIYSRDVPRLVPRASDDRTVHHSTVLRWMRRGVQGIRLEAIRVGRRWATSREALDRFFHNLAAQDGTGTPRQLRRRARLAGEALDAEGL